MITSPAPANFAYWDTVHEFLQQEIGWLWCGLEPPGPQGKSSTPAILPMMGKRIFAEINAAIQKGQFPSPSLYPRGYPRDVLRSWAEQQNYQPSFLYPELRSQAQSSLNLDGALQIIDALAGMIRQEKWREGTEREAVYGFAKTIEESGCNLPAKLIGKYLKLARK